MLIHQQKRGVSSLLTMADGLGRLLQVKIPKQKGAPLIAPLIPKGVKVLMDIMSNLRKQSFVDHDMKNRRDLDQKNYMDTV